MLPETGNVSPLAQLVREKMGGDTYTIERQITIGTAKIQILPNNPNRLAWLIQDVGAGDCQLAFSVDVLDGTFGYILKAYGGIISQDYTEDGEDVGKALWGRTTVTSTQLMIREVIRS